MLSHTPELANRKRNRKRTDEKVRLNFRSIIALIVSRSSSPEVCDVYPRSLEASRSRVGIAERDDILWFRCIVGT